MDALLTERESEVAQWLHEGKTSASIGKILGISHRTVEKHCERIYVKLGVSNRFEFLRHFMEKVGDKATQFPSLALPMFVSLAALLA